MGLEGGLPVGLLEKLRNGIRKSPFKEVARKPSRFGDIFIYEAWMPGLNKWIVKWACRSPIMGGLGQDGIEERWTSPSERIKNTYEQALKALDQHKKAFDIAMKN